jgi:drug/metabolite transporter (DMT)-like permease
MIGELIAIFAVLTFVVSNVLFRKTEHEATPIFINFFRTAIGTITFFIFSFLLNIFDKIFLLPFGLWIILFISFLFGQVIGDTAYFIAQKDLGTTVALGVSMTFPLFTFILSMLFLNREFEISLLFSLLFISAGVIIIGRSKAKINRDPSFDVLTNEKRKLLKGGLTFSSLRALIFGLVASLSWAIGLIIIESATHQIDALLSLQEGQSSILGNVIRFPFAVSILTMMVGKENYSIKKKNLSDITPWRKSVKTWGYLIIASLIGTSLGAYVYTEAARVAGSTVMSLIASASPLFSLPLTYLLNKEKISKIGFLGVVFTMIGVVLILI